MLFATAEDLERKKRAQATGVVDGRTPQQAVESLLTPPSAAVMPSAPMSPSRRAHERYGNGEAILRRMGNLFTGGLFDEQIIPEMSSQNWASYKADMGVYRDLAKDQMKAGVLNDQADPFRAMLEDDDKANDMQALQRLAVLQPDVYGPVLREMGIQQYAPDAATYTEGKWQLDPNYDNGEGNDPGRFYLERQASDGSTKKDYAQPGFTPASFLPGATYLDESIGKAQEQSHGHQANARGARNVLDRMEAVGEDNWTAGYAAKGSEFIKAVFGREDYVTGIRKEYQDIKVRNAISNLPPGVASDKDIELALSPWPEDTSNFALIKEKLEAIERIENARYEYRQFEGQYIESNRGRNGLQAKWNQTENAARVRAENEKNQVPVEDEDIEAILQGLGV